MIYITGDCHADFSRFSTRSFPEQTEMTRDDFVIVCGDFGGIWTNPDSDKTENYWLGWLETKPFTLLFVDGNHENFDRLHSDKFEVVDYHGGKAHKIRDNIYHLMRGYVFNIGGKRIFAFGGASSHDISDGILDKQNFESDAAFKKTIRRWRKAGKMFRINHSSWWEQEIPSQDEMDFGLKTLSENNNKVDFIISHCCPQTIASIFSYGNYSPDILTTYFDVVAETVDFSKWFFGHYHNNVQIMDKFIMLYEQIVRVA